MKIKELNKEINNLYYSKNKNIFVEKQEDKIYITDKYVVWIISEKDFIFDIDKFKKANIKSVVDFVANKFLYEAVKSNECIKDDSLIIVSFVNKEENIKVQINEKFLKYFDKNCSFKIVDDSTPVLVYEKEELVGMITPIKTY